MILKKIQATLMKKSKLKELLTNFWVQWKAIPVLRFFHPILLAVIAFVWLSLAIGIRITKSTYSMVKEGEFGPLPSYEELENPEVIRASEIYSRNNVSLGKYYSENRSDVTFHDLPQHLVHALLATEDARFIEHPGIDFKATSRAIVFLGKRGGGSTITQQLAKNLYKTRKNTAAPTDWEEWTENKPLVDKGFDKLKEYVISSQLEQRYSKEEILTLYLNTVEFSSNSFGIKAAAQTYFGVEPKDLRLEQAATLIGMLKAPTQYNPQINPEASMERRNTVIDQMLKYDYLSEAEHQYYRNQPLGLNVKGSGITSGEALYFREQVRLELAKILDSDDLTKSDGSKYNLYTDGLRIYTSIDLRMQELAEQAVAKHMRELQVQFDKNWSGRDLWKDKESRLQALYKSSQIYAQFAADGGDEETILNELMEEEMNYQVFTHDRGFIDSVMTGKEFVRYNESLLQVGFMVMDPQSGDVLAWIGGLDFNQSPLDHLNVRRQVGSTFKPLLYAKALIDRRRELDPCAQIPMSSRVFEGRDWQAKWRWTKGNDGTLSMKSCLASSNNSCSVNLMYGLGGPLPLIRFAGELGISEKQIPESATICLGSADITVYKMMASFSAFANSGIHTAPRFITRIENSDGQVIYQNDQNYHIAIDSATNRRVVTLMNEVTRSGTARSLNSSAYNIPSKVMLAGKTGTTQNNTDGWFIGYTPDLIAGVWVGGNERHVRFRSNYYGQGARMALPVWGYFMESVYNDENFRYSDAEARKEKFTTPLRYNECPNTIAQNTSVFSSEIGEEGFFGEDDGFFNPVFNTSPEEDNNGSGQSPPNTQNNENSIFTNEEDDFFDGDMP